MQFPAALSATHSIALKMLHWRSWRPGGV